MMQRFKKIKKGEKNKSIIERAAIIVEVWSKEVCFYKKAL